MFRSCLVKFLIYCIGHHEGVDKREQLREAFDWLKKKSKCAFLNTYSTELGWNR